MADEEIKQKIILEGHEKVREAFDRIGEAGSRAFDRVKSAGNNLSNSIDKVAQKLNSAGDAIGKIDWKAPAEGAERASSSVFGFSKNLGMLESTGGKVGGGLAALGIVIAGLGVAIIEGAKGAAEYIDKFKEMAFSSGQTFDQIQRLMSGFVMSGGSADKLSSALYVLNNAIGQAQKKGEQSIGAFQQFGIKLLDGAMKARPAEEIFKDIADRLEKIEKPGDKAAAVIAMFGRRAGPELVGFLSKGRAEIEKYNSEMEKLGLTFTEKEIENADKLKEAYTRLGLIMSNTKAKMNIQFAPVVTEGIEKYTDFWTSAAQKLLNFQSELSNWSAETSSAFVKLGIDIRDNLSFTSLANQAQADWTAITTFANDTINSIIGFFQGLGTKAQEVWTAIGAVSADIAGAVLSDWNNTVNQLTGLWQAFSATIDSVWQKIKAAVADAAGIGAGGSVGDTGSGWARGGLIRGPGTGTSDSIVARLSDNEYVIRAAAVRKYGVSFLQAVNSMRLKLSDLQGFAAGGLVTMQRPRLAFAEGGLVQSNNRPFVLQIGGQDFNMQTNDDTIGRLERYAVRRSSSSSGRKPSWFRGA